MSSQSRKCARPLCSGFSMVELMVAMAVLSLVLVVTFSVINQTSSLWTKTSGKISAFQEARGAFEAITRKISQATLNTYWDYDPPISAGTPTRYARESDLHFVSGPSVELLPDAQLPDTSSHAIFFQAPLGYNADSNSAPGRLSNLLNADGFFVQYNSDVPLLPNFLKDNSRVKERKRYRLMEMWQTSDEMGVFAIDRLSANTNQRQFAWFVDPLVNDLAARPIAENILALVLIPRRAEDAENTSSICNSDYGYNTREYLISPGGEKVELSRNQLPPIVQVAMVAIDEPSGQLLEARFEGNVPLLQAGALFSKLADYEKDLYESDGEADSATNLTKFLQSEKLNYRIFTTSVGIKQAKWSE